jgi:hypothetical protein
MMTGSSLIETLAATRGIPRGDEALTHVADLTTCLRAVAYRRRGATPEPFTARELAKFALGHGYEAEVAHTLTAAGHEVQTGIEVQAFGLDIGHPDILVDRELLIECKTTDGGANYPKSDRERAGQPKEVSPHHAIQAATYALALGVPKAVVLVKHAGIGDRGHEEIAHEIDPEAYREQIEMLAREVVALTGPDMPLPPAEPKPADVVPYDECAYCRYRLCERNPTAGRFA